MRKALAELEWRQSVVLTHFIGELIVFGDWRRRHDHEETAGAFYETIANFSA